ncbi:MAG: aminotransferase class I/II-fold pyridoxal phosphate-dependent enzyme [Lachnospirales bacterium]
MFNKNFHKDKYISEAIDDYLKENLTSFHMPSHKNRNLFFPENLLSIDFTEIYGFDNLSNPQNTIKKSLERIEKIYNTKKSYILVNGSTIGILTSILSTLSEDDLVLIGRDSHKSVFSGIELAKCDYKFIYKNKSQYNNYTDFDYENLENTIIKTLKLRKIKAMVVTSPTYEGIPCDIEKLSKITKKYNIILIVDEAHGAHFPHNKSLPFSAINKGADIVIQSLHKTMPALTQTALLHICTNKVSVSNIEKYLYMLQTTSPSYIFIYTIDKLMENLDKLPFENQKKSLKFFIKSFKELSKNDIMVLDYVDFEVSAHDYTRLVLFSKKINGETLHNILLEKYKFNFEMFTENYCIGITSSFDDFSCYDKLKNALLEIEKDFAHLPNRILVKSLDEQNYEIIKYRDWDNYALNSLDNSAGEIAYEDIIPYPPGIPLICKGEQITFEHINNIKKILNNKIEVLNIYEKNNDEKPYIKTRK